MSAIREIRRERGLSLARLAFLSKHDEGFLSKLERGVKVATPLLQERLSSVLGVDQANLFHEDGTAK